MSINIGWPQTLWLLLTFSALMISSHQHKKPRSVENFWTTLIAVFLQAGILIWGGFFRK